MGSEALACLDVMRLSARLLGPEQQLAELELSYKVLLSQFWGLKAALEVSTAFWGLQATNLECRCHCEVVRRAGVRDHRL